MIVVRDIFQIKFGQSKEASTLWKQGIAIAKKTPFGSGNIRILTDLAGPPYYTLILESSFDSVSQWEKSSEAVRANAEWKAWYPKVAALTEHGRREILSVIE